MGGGASRIQVIDDGENMVGHEDGGVRKPPALG